MKTNWKQVVQKGLGVLMRVPDGWTPNAAVARQLGCSENNVRKRMRPALDAGLVERQLFRVFSRKTGRAEVCAAYREIRAQKKPQPRKATGA